jgi:drug/metabolite transporter (DMT)-like permease
LIGFALMTGGGFVMFFSEKFPLKKLLPPVLLASALFGLANVLQKAVYNHTNFVSGYVWFTIGTFVAAMVLLIPPPWRKQIFSQSAQDQPRNRFWYFLNRVLAGVGSFLILYAISRANPAIVNAISGVRYGVIFLGALLLTKLKPMWLKETFRGAELAGKTTATCLVIAGLVLVGLSGGNKRAGPAAMERPARPEQLRLVHGGVLGAALRRTHARRDLRAEHPSGLGV